jgi:Zn-dependent M28 family amino/carboxypeptidase
MRRWILVAAVLALFATPGASAATDTSKLRDHVMLSKMVKHLQALQAIADANGGTRASGTSGYDASVEYVAGKLSEKGFLVTIQKFDFPFFQELADPELERVSPGPKTYAETVDFFTMTYSGSGDVTVNVQPVDTTATPDEMGLTTSGCEASDFAGFVPGRIALMQRGTCTFRVKADNAQAAGASAAIIFNRGNVTSGPINGTLGTPGVTIPVVGASFGVGQELYSASSSVVAHVSTSTISETRSTSNVLADTPGGRPDKVVIAGAHLDSVTEGPGVVDNGTGTAALLEIALNLNSSVNMFKTGGNGLTNKVRFAWWGAEELNLTGSRYYVSQLSPAQRSTITININFDMLASSNGVYFVQDGDGAHTGGPVQPGRSAELEHVFTFYFESLGLPWVPRPYDGRSDYQSFVEAGIGAGGLTSGSDQVKTAEQVALFGGTAGVIMHPAYHTAADRFDTVNMKFLDDLSDAGAHAILWFAMDGE